MDEDFKKVLDVIEHYHLVPVRRITHNKDRLADYRVDSKYGSGTTRFFTDGNSIVILVDVTFHEDIPIPEVVNDLIYTSYYDNPGVFLKADYLEPGTRIPLKKNTVYTNLALGAGWKSVFEGGKPSRGIIIVQPRSNDISLNSEGTTQVLTYTELRKMVRSLNNRNNQMELSLIYHQLLEFRGFNYTMLLYYKAKLNEIMAILLSQAMTDSSLKLMTVPKSLITQSVRGEIADILNYLRKHPGDRIGIEELAQIFHMSPSKLKYMFKSATGLTIGEYRRQLRVEYSEDLLRSSDMPVAKIAETMGFNTTSYFTTFFKKESGMTPREFRRFWNQNRNSQEKTVNENKNKEKDNPE